MNRVVPNGTLRGVEGEGKISPIRSWVKRAAVNGVSSNKYFCVPLDSVFAAVYNNFKSGLSKSRFDIWRVKCLLEEKQNFDF